MPLYQVIREESITCLRELYVQVIVPAEAPEKQDYGDVDFVVACPNAAIGHTEIKHISKTLEKISMIIMSYNHRKAHK